MQKVINSFISLDKWVSSCGYKGYDPYDTKGIKKLLWVQKSSITRKLSNTLDFVSPYFFRKILNVQKTINAKAMALFAQAYFSFFKFSGDIMYKEKGKICLNWLIENYCKGYSGYCWGYPFNWQSRILIPKGTPSSVVTSVAIDAFLDAYSILKEKKYLTVAESSCQFILNDLNWDNKNGCFSYTPLDHFHIHNANLLAAKSLFKISSLTKKDHYTQKAKRALYFLQKAQNKNGSWYYWSKPDKIIGIIDHYHTGFILRALYDIYRITNDQKTFISLKKGVKYYRNYLFSKEGFPLRMPGKLFPIDIHTCAEAILSSSFLKGLFSELENIDKRVLLWTISNMQDGKGFFYYRRYKFLSSKIGFVRWGEAWMLFALSKYLLKNFGLKNVA